LNSLKIYLRSKGSRGAQDGSENSNRLHGDGSIYREQMQQQGVFQHRSFGAPTKATDDVGKTRYLVELLDRETMGSLFDLSAGLKY
jgi:hypothetical protein